MDITPYHAKYFAHELTRRRAASVDDRISMSLFDARVDLNPHQIEAAHFALRSPLSKGVVLADEVGLGKTIEAGLVVCQFWAEKKRKILIAVPASLRKQWSIELLDKFCLPSKVLDAREYENAKAEGSPFPFERDEIVIVSFNFAARFAAEIRRIQWDLVVVDEAHKLRNAYKTNNRIGSAVRWAIEDRFKLLLTATPLQNTLIELYGLSTFLDEYIFGDIDSFRRQFTSTGADLSELKRRLGGFCKRSLRKQVLEYIKYTQRKAITRPFAPSDEEQKLYEALSEFMKREDTYAIPQNQRHLTILILRKLLASSSYAIAGTLDTMIKRLEQLRDGVREKLSLAEQIIYSEEIEEDIVEVDSDEEEPSTDVVSEPENPQPVDLQKLENEIAELSRYCAWARGIGIDTKTHALLGGLKVGFEQLLEMGAAKKTLIFTESCRTQNYLRNYLEANGYAGKLVLFNGTNSDPESRRIYEAWLEKNTENGRSTKSRAIDTRTALIEHFRDESEIMIATEAGAEGINLQFCSLVINYDLPWNPQRIEQRIGRCHRYGQQHDVVVLNFLNERNAADKRVLELLEEKFNLFSGVFGASDDVLGSIESGVDFEKRVLQIYQQCRTPDEIEEAFRTLRAELDERIRTRMDATRKILLETFDEDVHARLKLQLDNTRHFLDRFSRMFWTLTRFAIGDRADFDDGEHTFQIQAVGNLPAKSGKYFLISKTKENIDGDYLYRLSHPLGEYVINAGKGCSTPTAVLKFDITKHPSKITMVENHCGKNGWLTLQGLTINSFQPEEYLLFAAIDDDGKTLDQETCDKLFNCNATSAEIPSKTMKPPESLAKEIDRHEKAVIHKSMETNNIFFKEEQQKLDDWADDSVAASEKDLADTKAQLKAMRRQARQATSTEEHLACQQKVAELEKAQRKQRQRIFDIEDEIIGKRDKLVDALEKRMKAVTKIEPLFTVRWTIV